MHADRYLVAIGVITGIRPAHADRRDTLGIKPFRKSLNNLLESAVDLDDSSEQMFRGLNTALEEIRCIRSPQ
jgi:hypothetical protein